MSEIDRRGLLKLFGTAASLTALGPTFARATSRDSVTIGWPNDVPTWDPNRRLWPDAQSLLSLVYDAPIMQDPDLSFVPGLLTKWDVSADGLTVNVTLRDDVFFHDGTKMTAEDFRFTFFERGQVLHQGVDTANVWGALKDIEVTSPTEAIMKFKTVMSTVIPWLGFLGSFVVSKAYVEKLGFDAFNDKPMGTGPYKVVNYERSSRVTLERNEHYWGLKPKIKTITVEFIKDTSVRLAALQSGQVDIAIALPVRDTLRLKKDPAFSASIDPIQRIYLLKVRADGAMTEKNVRLAAHLAIDKATLSKAFYGGMAKPLSVFATPGNPGYPDDFVFPYDREKAKQMLTELGYGPDKPVTLSLGTYNGVFPGDFDVARAIAQMWSSVGIKADIHVIDPAQRVELERAGKLPDATLDSWDNATGDPEIYIGYMMNPNLPFSTFRIGDIGARAAALFTEPDYSKRIAAYRQLNIDAVNEATIIPLMQAVQTILCTSNLTYQRYDNGYVLGQSMRWK